MADAPDGIDMMRRRMARAQRVPPAPRRPASPTPPVVSDSGDPAAVEAGEPAPPVAARRPRSVPVARTAASARPRVVPSDPPVNLAIRVRQPLDEHLVDLLHDLRKAGVRSSKVELIEMLLWELPSDTELVRSRLGAFRRAAPRGADGV